MQWEIIVYPKGTKELQEKVLMFLASISQYTI